MPYLSIVSPVYNTGEILPALVSQISEVVQALAGDYELILVDDGSPDDAWSKIRELSMTDAQIRGIKLSRNFGQHAALTAGLEKAEGEGIVVMDSDLQDLPREIPRLLAMALTGYEVVVGQRTDRKDGLYRKMISKLFNLLLTRWSGMTADHRSSNFGIYSRRVIREVLTMKESVQLFPMMVSWTGFQRSSIEVEHGERPTGASAYNFRTLLRLAINGFLSYSDKPLRYVVKAGLFISLVSFLFGIVTLIRYLRGEILVLGYTSLILSIWFLSGLLLFTLGIVGMYVGKTFEEAKRRPRFIIEAIIGRPASNGG